MARERARGVPRRGTSDIEQQRCDLERRAAGGPPRPLQARAALLVRRPARGTAPAALRRGPPQDTMALALSLMASVMASRRRCAIFCMRMA